MATKTAKSRKARPKSRPAASPAQRARHSAAASPAAPQGEAPVATTSSPALAAKPDKKKAKDKPKKPRPAKKEKSEKKHDKDRDAPPKLKLVRDSFTMPSTDYSLIGMLKTRSLAAGVAVKKSELLRAGLISLSVMPPARLFELMEGLPKIKTGRPGKKKK